MKTIRAFIALEIGSKNKQKISQLISRLKEPNADVKWVNEEQMHLTLKFLGNINEDIIPKISSILNEIAQKFTSFSIKFSKIGAFPNINKPKVVWLGIDEGSENLKHLNNDLETSLKKVGFEEEGREFKTHLTLGRVRSFKNLTDLTRLLGELDFQAKDEIKIDKIILFQSELFPKGAIYTPLVTVNLKD